MNALVDGVPLVTDVDAVTGGSDEDDAAPVEEEPAYFAPTDPIIASDAQGNIEVLGGFAPTSLSDVEVEPSAEDDVPGDEAIADAVRRELREDAATTDLRLSVDVEQGVVKLRGKVPGLEDAENAEAMAAEIPGVRDVIDETDVASLQRKAPSS